MDRIAVLDLGSQYSFLIARRIREHSVYAEVLPPDTPTGHLRTGQYKGVVLSGGPASVYRADAPACGESLFELGLPVLGICYGMHLIADAFGGRVQRASKREFGSTVITTQRSDPIWGRAGKGTTAKVWMSHGDAVTQLPSGFIALASSANCQVAAMRHGTLPLYGLQFHPEVVHTEGGAELLGRFVKDVCGCTEEWTPGAFVERAASEVRGQVGAGEVLCAVSGGVDSTVMASIVARAVGDRLHCVFVDTGLLRWGESGEVRRLFRKALRIPLVTVDSSQRFLKNLRGVTDPEHKRVTIGHTFVEVFQEVAERWPRARFLAQGTLYPDRIESTSQQGPSATIKTHHNVGGLPQWLRMELVEPLKDLFKDEARAAGRYLGLPHSVVNRHPFPGPGLAVRIVGDVTSKRLSMLRSADRIYLAELRKAGCYDRVWQAFAVLLPVKSVGVMGDERTYQNVVALRAVVSTDAMTADWVRFPGELLARISGRITNEVRGVNRVVYDVTSKPPGTIEWE